MQRSHGVIFLFFKKTSILNIAYQLCRKEEQIMNVKGEAKEQEDYVNFNEAQEAIYKELPTVVEKVFHAAFMNCTKGFPVTDELDWNFIAPFISEMERVFKISVQQQKEFLIRLWKYDEQMTKCGSTRKECEGNAK